MTFHRPQNVSTSREARRREADYFTKCFLAILFVIALNVLPLASVSANKAKTMSIATERIATSQDAIKRALEFCQAIGQPVDDVAHIEYIPVKINDISAYWRPQWAIKFKGRTTINVDSSGTISQFSYTPLSAEHPITYDPPERLSGHFLTETEATRRAKSIFQSMRLPDEVNLEGLTADIDTSAHSQEAGQRLWWFRIRRFFDGIAYIDQSCVLALNALTGELSGSRINFHSLPPLSSVIAITKEQAIAIAAHHLTTIGITGIKHTKHSVVREYVVTPNGFFGAGNSYASRSKVAWVSLVETSNVLYIIYVDAQTGKVIGGDMQFQ